MNRRSRLSKSKTTQERATNAIYDCILHYARPLENSNSHEDVENALTFIREVLLDAEEDGSEVLWMSSCGNRKRCESSFFDIGEELIKCRSNVLLCSSMIFTPYLHPHSPKMQQTVEGKGVFQFPSGAYSGLDLVLRRFKCLPTCFFPVCYDDHWGYVYVEPKEKHRVAVFWGDSMGYSPPPGLLDSVRAYLCLIYRTASFYVESKNHCTEVLGYERQKDGHSCGFYILAAMAEVCGGWNCGELGERGLYKSYDATTTELIRRKVGEQLISVVIDFLRTERNKREHEIDIRAFLRERSLAKNSDDMKMQIELSPTFAICADNDTKLRAKGKSSGSVESIDESDDNERQTQNVDPGIFNESDVQKGDFTHPVTASISPRNRKGSWSFKRIVDHNTLYLNSRMGITDSASDRGTKLTEAGKNALDEESLETDVKEDEESLKQVVIVKVQPATKTSTQYPSDPSLSLSHRPSAQDPVVTSPDPPGQSLFQFPLLKPGPEGHNQVQNVPLNQNNGSDLQSGIVVSRSESVQHPVDMDGSEDSIPQTVDNEQRRESENELRAYKAADDQRMTISGKLHPTNFDVANEVRRSTALLSSEDGDSEVAQQSRSVTEYVDLQCNMFAYLFEIIEHCHPLCSPYIRTYKKKKLHAIRCRFRCSGYRRFKCNAQVISRLRCDGTWEVSFRHKHSGHHPTKENSTEVMHRVIKLYKSIRRLHQSIDIEFNEWVATVSDGMKDMILGVLKEEVDANQENTDEPSSFPSIDICDGDSSRIHQYIHDIVENYMTTAHLQDGKEVVRDLKHVMSSFGYPSVVRNSKYSEKGRGSLVRADFRCVNKESSCPFRITVRAAAPGQQDIHDDVDDSMATTRHYILKFLGWHNHKHQYSRLHTSLPEYIWKEVFFMRESSMIPISLIVRYIEDKYGILVRRENVSRKLRYRTQKKYPRDDDCKQLVYYLSENRKKDPHMYMRVQLGEDNSLKAVCWGYREWLEDYYSFGVVPGVSLDAKALATSYDTPFVSIGGRDHNGKLAVYFMGFIPNEREESMAWFLQSFKQFVVAPPSTLCCDQDSSILRATEVQLPTTLVVLDHWHLNKNQRANCILEYKKSGQTWGQLDWADLNNALYDLRASSSPETFIERRDALENTYFCDRGLPRWYVSLYHSRKEMVARCYNRSSASFTFFFQGSGYSESLNSLYKKLIMAKKLPLCRVPAEIGRYFYKKKIENEEDLKRIKYDKASHKLLISTMGLNEHLWLIVVKQFTNFAIKKVIEEAIPSSSKYDVQPLTEAILPLSEPISLQFRVSKVSNPQQGRIVKWEQIVEGPYSYTKATCDCFWYNSYGLPCGHIFRVFAVIAKEVQQKVPFDIRRCFHWYWLRQGGGWRLGAPVRSHIHAVANVDDMENRTNEQVDRIREDRERQYLWSNGHNAWNFIHRRVATKGLGSLKTLDLIMKAFVDEINKDGDERELNAVSFMRKLTSSVESKCPDLPEDWELNSESIAQITNTNYGNPRGRRSNKRARSHSETIPKGKRGKS